MAAPRSAADRRTEREVAAARLLIELADSAGVAESPSAVRYRLARILGAELSQAAVDRLYRRLVETMGHA